MIIDLSEPIEFKHKGITFNVEMSEIGGLDSLEVQKESERIAQIKEDKKRYEEERDFLTKEYDKRITGEDAQRLKAYLIDNDLMRTVMTKFIIEFSKKNLQ
jgi:hypothetical protein